MERARRSHAPSRIEQWAALINRLRRATRIALSVVIALELTLLISLIVDRLLIAAVYDGDVGAMVPALIAVGFGVLFYVIGWWALVGFDADPTRPWRAGRPAVLYAAVGAAGVIALVMLILIGLAQGYIL